MRVTISRAIVLAVLAVAMTGPRLLAADPENCLICHRYEGLGRIDEQTGTVRLFQIDPAYYDQALGPHVRLKCTDCHEYDEVAVVPHEPVSPVNCTRVCHLVEPGEPPRTFAHAEISDMLNLSVHRPITLEKANEVLGNPIRPDQAQCLLCHDEPTFRRPGHSWVEREAPVQRCNVCHTERLPIDTRFYYWHVYARSKPARSNEDIVRMCGTCHSDPAIQNAFELPDATASYLVSFHGKAMQLGSQETAACLNCHVGPMQNVHFMQSYKQAGSPTSPERQADTCRSPSCHPAAGRNISSAAVHLQLATSRGIEYFIAALFILLIVATFGPSAVLTGLEMLQVVLGREDPAHAHHRERASRLLSNSRGRDLLKRFTPHQRVQHWLLFLTFTSLVITGFPIKFADQGWAAWLINQMGGLWVARMVHRSAGALLLAGCGYHLLYVANDWRRKKKQSGKGWITTFMDMPMVMRPADFKDLGLLILYLLGLRKTRPGAGRFSLEEKFEYFGVFWGIALLGITGIVLWANPWTTRYLPGRTLTIATVIHSFEAFLAMLHVGIVHMVTVIFAPSVFPVSRAMFTGDTPLEELAEAHAGLIDEVDQKLTRDGSREDGNG